MKQSEKIVKCACGLPMRQKNWEQHWRVCGRASSAPVTKGDVPALLAQEERKQDTE